MSVFTQDELAYLQSQRLGRIATAGPGGQPHVVPVGFRYNPDHGTIDVGGHGFAARKKYRDVLRNPRVAIVIDDLASVAPWRPRGIEIRGTAEVHESGGEQIGPGFDPEMFRIKPARIISWGLGEGGMASNARTVGSVASLRWLATAPVQRPIPAAQRCRRRTCASGGRCRRCRRRRGRANR